jgi:hypothetical protein
MVDFSGKLIFKKLKMYRYINLSSYSCELHYETPKAVWHMYVKLHASASLASLFLFTVTLGGEEPVPSLSYTGRVSSIVNTCEEIIAAGDTVPLDSLLLQSLQTSGICNYTMFLHYRLESYQSNVPLPIEDGLENLPFNKLAI